jgi:hypothetical protein
MHASAPPFLGSGNEESLFLIPILHNFLLLVLSVFNTNPEQQ